MSLTADSPRVHRTFMSRSSAGVSVMERLGGISLIDLRSGDSLRYHLFRLAINNLVSEIQSVNYEISFKLPLPGIIWAAGSCPIHPPERESAVPTPRTGAFASQ